MAYQPKSYKKFIATAATATLVATAIVPVASAADAKSFKDVSKTYQEAVNYLVTNDIAQGKSDTMFGTTATITRGDAAVMIAKALKLDTAKAPSAGFKDVNARVAGAVNALVEAKIVSGKTATTFAPDANITRQEMAKIITNAYELDAGTTKNKFNDVNNNWDAYVDALVANSITLGKTETTFAPTASVTRGEFALFVFRTENLAPATPSVISVSATNSTTLTLTGNGLQNLKKENLTLAGNVANEVTASKDGKTATVKFATAFVLDQELSLVVKVADVEKAYKFKFTYDVTTAAVDAGTFDDDTKGQKVSLKINGADADFNALRVAGYTVKFVAVSSSNTDVTTQIFSNPDTGALKDSLAIGDYTVQVSVSKGSNVVVSEKQTIKVRNLELAATAVKEYVLANNASTVGEQMSSTLVVGENANITEITVTANGADYDVTDTTKFKVASSNPAVISVGAGGTLTANTPGTATITVTYGDVKKDITLTVANAARKVSKFTPASSSVTIVGTKTSTVSVSAVDQYGDLVKNTPITVEVPSVVTSTNVTTGANGKANVSVTGAATGSGTVLLKSNGTTFGSFGVRVTQYDNVASKRLEVVNKPTDATYSTDGALDLSSDSKVEYALNLFNSENIANGTQSLAAYKVSYNADVVTIGSNANGLQEKNVIGGTGNLTIAAKNTGSTTVVVYDAANLLVGQFTVTVTNSGYSVKAVNFKAVPTIDYKNKAVTAEDVLDTTAVALGKDRIVKGITLSKPTAHAVRITALGEVYIDADGSGTQQSVTEPTLATVTGEVVSGATNLTVGAFPIFTGVTPTASGDKGTIVFKVQSGSYIIASTSVTVNVK